MFLSKTRRFVFFFFRAAFKYIQGFLMKSCTYNLYRNYFDWLPPTDSIYICPTFQSLLESTLEMCCKKKAL